MNDLPAALHCVLRFFPIDDQCLVRLHSAAAFHIDEDCFFLIHDCILVLK